MAQTQLGFWTPLAGAHPSPATIFDATLGNQIHGLLTGATTAEPETAPEAVETPATTTAVIESEPVEEVAEPVRRHHRASGLSHFDAKDVSSISFKKMSPHLG